MNIQRTNRRANTRGQSLAELAAGMMIFIPIILILVDCSIIMIGVSANESACRDAARAAASSAPASMISGQAHSVSASSAPYKAALTVIKNLYATGGLASIDQSLVMKEALQDPLPQSPQGGALNGTVSVETTASVSPPFLLRAFVENGTFKFKCTQSYPYTYIMPSS